jgi:hypothetical protein
MMNSGPLKGITFARVRKLTTIVRQQQVVTPRYCIREEE